MKPSLTLLMFGLICGSCNHKNESPHAAAMTFNRADAPAFREDEFSPWMTKAEQQVIYENTPTGRYFAYTEGRNLGGLNQYRHVLRPTPQEKYSEWAVFWGLSADDFYQLELKMLRTGYARERLQVFVDGQGVAFHQAVWLKARPDTPNAKPETATPKPK